MTDVYEQFQYKIWAMFDPPDFTERDEQWLESLGCTVRSESPSMCGRKVTICTENHRQELLVQMKYGQHLVLAETGKLYPYDYEDCRD